MATIPDIFIIESLGPDDEGNGRLEGPIIAHIAKLHGKSPTYRYVRNRKDFAKAVRAFAKSSTVISTYPPMRTGKASRPRI